MRRIALLLAFMPFAATAGPLPMLPFVPGLPIAEPAQPPAEADAPCTPTCPV